MFNETVCKNVITDGAFSRYVETGDVVTIYTVKGSQEHHRFTKLNDETCKLDDKVYRLKDLIDFLDKANCSLIIMPDMQHGQFP